MSDVTRAVQFANPVTGEVLTLDAPDSDLGRYLTDLREFESVLREHKSMVNRELLARFDRRAKWTHHVDGGLKLSAASPRPEESWDGAELREQLLRFVDEERLSVEALDAAVEMVVRFEVRKAGVKNLRALGGEIAETIDRLAVVSEPKRYVSVGRS